MAEIENSILPLQDCACESLASLTIEEVRSGIVGLTRLHSDSNRIMQWVHDFGSEFQSYCHNEPKWGG